MTQTASHTITPISDANAIALLREVVETPSPSLNERAVAELLVKRMREHGLQAAIDEAGNAVGATFGDPLAPIPGVEDIILLGHMDVVPGHVPVRIEGRTLYGRGTVDAKGPLCAFIAAATGARVSDRFRIVVIGAVEEEISTSAGARAVRERYRPAACIIGEPSGVTGITIGYKGRVIAECSFARSLSHTAGPDQSACDTLMSWWNSLNSTLTELNQGRTGAFDRIQSTVRSIRSSTDGLRESASCCASFRLPPWISSREMREIVAASHPELITRFRGAEECIRAPRDSAVVRALSISIRASTQQRPALVLKTGTSDMNVVGGSNGWSCPIAAYGAGDSRLDHTPDEHIDLDEFVTSIHVLTNAINTLME